MKIKLLLMGGIVLMMGLTGCQPQVDMKAEKQALLDTDRRFAQTSLEVGAAEAFHRFFAEDAMMMPTNNRPLYGLEAIFKGMEGDYTLAWEPQDGEVSVCADMGWTWGRYKYTAVDENGNEQHSYGKYLNVWKKIDGQWKVAVDIGNSSPAPE